MKTLVKGFAVSLVIIGAVFGCIAQDKLRRIEQPPKYVYPNPPIQVAFSMDGKQLPEREVKAGAGWLREISLEVANISGKNINWILIDLMLREPEPGVSPIVITVELPYSEPRIKVLLAGDRVTLKPPDRLVDYWTKYAHKQGLVDIEKVVVDIRQVGFTDETSWFRGIRSRKDPETGRPVFLLEKSKPAIFPSVMSLIFSEISPVFFYAEFDSNEPETDPGGCVWLTAPVPTEPRGCTSTPRDGCVQPACERLQKLPPAQPLPLGEWTNRTERRTTDLLRATK